jgi:predicted O-methyltransferase YrrM
MDLAQRLQARGRRLDHRRHDRRQVHRAPVVKTEAKILEMVRMARSAPPGDFVEVGVYDGSSAAPLAEICREQGRHLFLFDTFSGHPHKSEFDVHGVGDMAFNDIDAVWERVGRDDHVTVLPGVFPKSFFTAPSDAIVDVAFIHEDTDQYQSTKDVIKYLYPWLVRGGRILFDDYDTPDCRGSRKAIDECGHELHHTPFHTFIVKK